MSRNIKLTWVKKFEDISKKHTHPEDIVQKFTEYCVDENRKYNERVEERFRKVRL